MGKEKINYLKSIASQIDSTTSMEKQVELLSKGFELFSEETHRLEESYGHLHEKFQQVNQKLEITNERLGNKVQELHVLTNYLDNILSNMAQGLLFVDLDGHITTYNKAAEEILEVPKSKALFEPFTKCFPDDLFGFSLTEMLSHPEVKKNFFIKLKLPHGKEKEIEVDFTIVPGKETHKLFDFTQGVIILLRDITEFRRLQVAANRSDRMKALGEMAAQVAHEIRNPLGGIKGFASLLQRDLEDNPKEKRLADYIVEGANTLDRLVDKILNYTRPLQPQLESKNLKTVIEEIAASLLAEGILNEKIVFKVICRDQIEIPLDSGLFKSAIRNFFINAIQAMPEGGTLTVTLEKEKGKTLIKIEDTGIGIEEEHMKKIFSPFFTTKASGNGLGLAESHKVIQAHGGEITVNSTPKIGTSFIIKL